MLDEKLKNLAESLKLAKEANELTVSNIAKIVGDATHKIVDELTFDKDMGNEVIKNVLDTTASTLEELESLTADNIKASSDGAMNAMQSSLKGEMGNRFKKLEALHTNLAEDIKEDTLAIAKEFKAFGELAFDVLAKAAQGAIKGAQEALEKKETSKNNETPEKSEEPVKTQDGVEKTETKEV
jgi:hypothetical protein